MPAFSQTWAMYTTNAEYVFAANLIKHLFPGKRVAAGQH